MGPYELTLTVIYIFLETVIIASISVLILMNQGRATFVRFLRIIYFSQIVFLTGFGYLYVDIAHQCGTVIITLTPEEKQGHQDSLIRYVKTAWKENCSG